MIDLFPIEVLWVILSFCSDSDLGHLAYISKSLYISVISAIDRIHLNVDNDDFRCLYFLYRKVVLKNIRIHVRNDAQIVKYLLPLISLSNLQSFSFSYFDDLHTQCLTAILETLNECCAAGRCRNLDDICFTNEQGLTSEVRLPQSFFVSLSTCCTGLRTIRGIFNHLEYSHFVSLGDSRFGFFQQSWPSIEALDISDIGRSFYFRYVNDGADIDIAWTQAWKEILSMIDNRNFPKLARIILKVSTGDEFWMMLGFFEATLLHFREQPDASIFSKLREFEFNFMKDSKLADSSQLWNDALRKFNVIPASSDRSLNVFRLPVIFQNTRSIKFNTSVPCPCICDVFGSSSSGLHLEIQETVSSTQYGMTSKLLSRLASGENEVKLSSLSINASKLEEDVAFYEDYSGTLVLPVSCPLCPAIISGSELFLNILQLKLYSLWFTDDLIENLKHLRSLSKLTIVHEKLSEEKTMYSYNSNQSFMDTILKLFRFYILHTEEVCFISCLNLNIPCQSEWIKNREIFESVFCSLLDIGDFSVLLHTLNHKQVRSHSPLPDHLLVQERLKSIQYVGLRGFRSALIYRRKTLGEF